MIRLDEEQNLIEEICRKLQINKDQVENYQILKRSLDARIRNRLVWQYSLLVQLLDSHISHPDLLDFIEQQPYITPLHKLFDQHPIIIGAGPAGLFCALGLVEKGLKPLIFDQGDCIEDRDIKIRKFRQEGILDDQSNIQFGEGGAGAYSDGKLTARNQDYYSHKVYQYLVKFGADPDILINAHPHLGTDKLRNIIKEIRKYLLDMGCKFFWNHKLEDLTINQGKVASLKINGETYQPEIIILAPGNAARELFKLLAVKVPMESKVFAVGYRIEHKQDFIDKLFYGEKTDITLTGAAEYRIKVQSGGRSVYSFCMCPGGIIVNAASEAGGIVTNGMSWSKRNGKFSNAALVTPVNITESAKDILAGVRFQEMIEAECYNISGSYCAPAQDGLDFVENKLTRKIRKTTCLPGIISANLADIYPLEITSALRKALLYWDKRYNGFAREGLLVAPETRTSSPVRILRNPGTGQCLGAENLFPIGEGSGYAGGIISSAADGIKLFALMKY